MSLPILYKKTKTGAVQTYEVTTDGPTVVVTQGQLDGKKQSYTTTCTPKNIGKSNETTAEDQALLEAASKHSKKLKSGYVKDPSGEIQVKLPQKVKPYIGNENKITFPAYSTYKLNGVNAIYWLQEDGSLKLTSRGGDEYPPIPHLEYHVKHIMRLLKTDAINGELYIHGEHLQDITSAVKKPKKLSTRLTFRFFEFPNYEVTGELLNDIKEPYTSKSFKYKVDWLNILKFQSYQENVEPVPIIMVKNPKELEAHYQQAIQDGYEGTVIYNATSEYKFNQRSSSVFKYKKAQDAEFKVVDYELDKNGHVVFTCKTNNANFKVKPKGTNAERKVLSDNANDYLGQWLKVEFETLSKDGIPLKPVGITFRNCDALGNPLE